MNKHNIIFINGLSVPKILSKTKYVWNDKLWLNYNRTYLSSYIPTSDFDAQRKVKDLTNLINSLDNPIIICQSLGAWWGAILACTKECNLHKLIMVTPLSDVKHIPFFNVSNIMSPLKMVPIHTGPHKVLVCSAKYDIICPPSLNAYLLLKHFNALNYEMDGGHFYQKDHISALNFMQDWIEL
jgi:hypothetical protein